MKIKLFTPKEGAHELVVEALRRFETLDSSKGLTVEEAVMCYYQRLCRRVPPGHVDARGYERGSLLMLPEEAIVVLNDTDFDMYPSYDRLRFCGHPTRKYRGLLPESKLLKNGLRTLIIMSSELVNMFRRIMADGSVDQGGKRQGATVFSITSSRAEGYSCAEAQHLAAGLAGWKSSEGFKKVLPELSALGDW